jgi:hypothetical protein
LSREKQRIYHGQPMMRRVNDTLQNERLGGKRERTSRVRRKLNASHGHPLIQGGLVRHSAVLIAPSSAAVIDLTGNRHSNLIPSNNKPVFIVNTNTYLSETNFRDAHEVLIVLEGIGGSGHGFDLR